MALLGLAPDVPKHEAPAVRKGAYEIAGADAVKDQAGKTTDATNAIEFDWSGVDAALGNMAKASAPVQAQAGGQNLTAGTEEAMQQDGGTEVPQTAASLAQALLAKGKTGAGQARQVADAGAQQQTQAMQLATQLQQAQTAAKMQKVQMQLELQNQKFAITNGLTQATNALTLTQAALHNAYLNSLAKAKNGTDALNLGANFQNSQAALATTGAALGAAATATAALAGRQAQAPGAAAAAGNNTAVANYDGAGSSMSGPGGFTNSPFGKV